MYTRINKGLNHSVLLLQGIQNILKVCFIRENLRKSVYVFVFKKNELAKIGDPDSCGDVAVIVAKVR